MATLGLFGKHICNAIVHKISTTLRNDRLIKGLTEDGNPRYIISEAALENVYDRLCERLQQFHSSHAGFQLTSKYTAHFKNVFLNGKGTFTAGRMVMLMPAIIFVLRDLLTPEIQIIRRELTNQGKSDRAAALSNLKDPWKDIVEALSSFLDWFIMARGMLFPLEDAPELQKRARFMKQELQRVFPEKSGEKSAKPWNFPKAHAPDHTASEIMGFGSTAFTDTQVFEAGHKPNVKALANLTNRKDQFYCMASHHDRTSHLSKINQAVSRHTKVLARRRQEEEEDSSLCSSSDSAAESIDGEDVDDDLTFDERSSRPCEVCIKLPLWDMSFDLKALHKTAEANGKRGRGLQRIVLAACKPGAANPSARAAPSSTKRFSYHFSQQLPDLRYLPTQLAHFAYEYLADKLGLQRLPEPQRDLNRVLTTCLVADQDKCDIFTFGGLAIRSEHLRGTVRVRARPFPGDRFHGTNPQVSDWHRVFLLSVFHSLDS